MPKPQRTCKECGGTSSVEINAMVAKIERLRPLFTDEEYLGLITGLEWAAQADISTSLGLENLISERIGMEV